MFHVHERVVNTGHVGGCPTSQNFL